MFLLLFARSFPIDSRHLISDNITGYRRLILSRQRTLSVIKFDIEYLLCFLKGVCGGSLHFWARKLPGDYYVKAIRFEFPKDSVKRYMINCYCSEWEYHDPVIEIPDFRFRMSIKYWWAVEIRDFIEHVNKFFPQWKEEVQLIEHEVPKIEKLRRMREIRSERMRLRTFEPFIESCHQGLCEIKEGRLCAIVPLSNGRDLSIEMPVQSHNPDWWEKIQAMVSAIIELFETQIAENRFNWSPHLREVICTSRTCGYWGFDSWRYKWIRREDLEGLFRKKKTWRKYMPITVKMV